MLNFINGKFTALPMGAGGLANVGNLPQRSMGNILGLPMQSKAPNNIAGIVNIGARTTPTAQPAAPNNILQFSQPENMTRAPSANANTMAQQLMREAPSVSTLKPRGMVNGAINDNSNQYLNKLV
jgi:hypothetical protein